VRKLTKPEKFGNIYLLPNKYIDMSLESPQTPQENLRNEPTQEDLQAADQLIIENELLEQNPRVKLLQENNFVTEDGRQLDAGNFLAAMLDYIDTQEAGSLTEEDISAAVANNS